MIYYFLGIFFLNFFKAFDYILSYIDYLVKYRRTRVRPRVGWSWSGPVLSSPIQILNSMFISIKELRLCRTIITWYSKSKNRKPSPTPNMNIRKSWTRVWPRVGWSWSGLVLAPYQSRKLFMLTSKAVYYSKHGHSIGRNLSNVGVSL